MTAADSNPGIGLAVTLADGRVTEVTISPRRLPDTTALLKNTPAVNAPSLVGTLFTLCAASQRIASQAALSAAIAQPITETMQRRWALALHAERIAEHLRAAVLDWPGAGDSAERRAFAPAVRAALSAAREAGAPGVDISKIRADLMAAARETGAPTQDFEPPSQGWWGRLWRDASTCAEAAPFPPQADFLSAADAGAVHRALRARSRDFLSRPTLPGRAVETGAFARRFAQLRRDIGLFAARLQAQLLDIVDSLDALRSLENSRGLHNRLVAAWSHSPGEGFSLVDSPRGLLFHRIAVGADGGVTSYDILAPTEWNFHPAGPLARLLATLDLSRQAQARLFIARLMALFDPCTFCTIELREARHA
ncbi:nickel-dependent hydrogenase large subunit [Methylocystis sp. ATCC 49242]|uniref:nickel-dependent hydrogenase large subunit n=1 Tax=Methylocystis sp. ATCC 49242 TaxID=622637 RepID=UPI0001F886B6|nr:nickel-dependent hydrogenase large subunit [Methylocystis sp. ATCC 49242]